MATLLGPPEAHNPKYSPHQTTTTTTTTTTTSTPSDPFVDLMVAKFNSTTINPQPPMGLTENLSPTFVSSGNPCLDFFFHVVPDTPPDSLLQRLHVAWSHSPLTALKLVCNLRGVRGTGKSDREGFYAAATWLHAHHPKTLAANVPSLAEFGYFKDLPEILYRLLEGSDVRKTQKEQWLQAKGSAKRNRTKNNRKGARPLGVRTRTGSKPVKNATNEVAETEKAIVSKEEKKVAMAKKLLDRCKVLSSLRQCNHLQNNCLLQSHHIYF